ncbi:hypothetical protein [Kribbella hippodromi]
MGSVVGGAVLLGLVLPGLVLPGQVRGMPGAAARQPRLQPGRSARS